jgi:hypothetical protein
MSRFSSSSVPAVQPVHRGSVCCAVTFTPLPKKQAAAIYHKAAAYDCQTHRPGQHGGAVGHIGMKVLYVLLFSFLNHQTGRLDPSYEAIARKANVSRAALAEALKRLRALGLLRWQRRCTEARGQAGRFVLKQETNAYTVQPPSQWPDFHDRAAAPPPHPQTWGATPPLACVIEQAAAAGSFAAALARLEEDPRDKLAAILARLGRAIKAAEC